MYVCFSEFRESKSSTKTNLTVHMKRLMKGSVPTKTDITLQKLLRCCTFIKGIIM